MSIKITRRVFVAGAGAFTTLATGALALDQAAFNASPWLIRLTHGSYGGTSCYRFASICQKLAAVQKNDLNRDWSQKFNSFQIFTSRPLEDIVKAISLVNETVQLEVSRSALVTAEHKKKLPFHNFKRASFGFSKITLEEFAALYPTVGSRSWIKINAPQQFNGRSI